MLGFDSGARGLVTAVKEAVDNALDATEEAGVLPDIYIEIEEVGDYYRLVIEDNGPGITKEQLPKVFGKLLYGSRFHAREQSRGQQGIGISAAVLYSQLTSGQPAKITSRPKGQSRAQYFELIIDTDTNEPEIKADEETTWDRPHGTRIELEMEANMRARNQLHDYVKHTAVVNPHARFELREPGLDEPLKFERDRPTSCRPRPRRFARTPRRRAGRADQDAGGDRVVLRLRIPPGGVHASRQEDRRQRHRQLSRRVLRSRTRVVAPRAHDDRDVAAAVAGAVANKGKAATTDFADGIAETVAGNDRLSRSELATIVDNVAETVEDDTGKTFGGTVRENAVDAAWQAISGAGDDDGAGDSGRRERRSERVVTRRRRLRLSRRRHLDPEGRRRGAGDGRSARAPVREPRRRRVPDHSRRPRTPRRGRRLVRHRAARRDVRRDCPRERRRDVLVAGANGPGRPPKVTAIAGDRDASADLLEAMRTTDILAPPTDCLAPPIGRAGRSRASEGVRR